MSRLDKITLENSEGKVKEQLTALNEKMGMVPNIFKSMANSSATTGFYLQANEALATGTLTTQEREAIALLVAESNGCNYCLAAHTAIGAGAGISADESKHYRKANATDDKIKALLTFTNKLVKDKGSVNDDDIAAIKSAGYNDAAISEIPAVVAVNIFTNYFNHINQTEVDFPAAPAL